jgi:hypothetical protein
MRTRRPRDYRLRALDRRRRCLSAMIVAAATIVPAARAVAQATPAATRADLEKLFAAFAALGERRARFVERRHSVLFRNPPEARGTLAFTPPALLERETVAPHRERVRIDGQQVTLWSTGADGRAVERSVRLDVVPQLAALADTLRAMLGGDLRALERLFDVQMRFVSVPRGAATARWALDLKPVDESIGALVRAVRVDGHAAQVDRIEFTEASGDRSELAIVPLEAERR